MPENTKLLVYHIFGVGFAKRIGLYELT